MYYKSWNTRTTIPNVLAAALLLVTNAPRARAATVDATGCKRAIAKAAATFERAKLKALQGCEDKKRKGKLPAGTICATEAKTAPKIAKAQAALSTAISKGCGTLLLSQIGWDGSGSGGNPVLATACADGERQGDACSLELQCPGSCVGGNKDTEGCTFNSTCQGRICQHANCIGGTQDKQPCDSAATRTTCINGGGVCNWLEECDGGSSSKLGLCAGGSNANNTCFADSDCPGSYCMSGCNTGNNLDCVAGYCTGALCASNKDCGACTAGPNFQQTCAADADCGKACSGHGNAPCANTSDCKACSGHGNGACQTNADCIGGDICGVDGDTCGTVTGACTTGTCTAGFCAAAGPENRRLSSAPFCAPVDRCPNFENNKLASVRTCDGGSNNGKSCATDADCPSGGKCNTGCSFALSTAADVASCVACIGEASVDQLNGMVYGNLKPATYSCVGGANDGSPCTLASATTDCPPLAGKKGKCKLTSTGLELCKQAVGKAAAKFFDTKRGLLQKCEDAVLKAGTGTCPNAATTDNITAAADKLGADIAKACGGKDKAFGGSGAINLDFPADAIGQLFNCNNLTVPNGGPACAGVTGRGPITTLEDLVNCIQCVTEFKVDCTDRLATPSAGPLFAECNPRCGNALTEGHCSTTTSTVCASTLDCPSGETCVPVETCDDGNSATGDTCPGNCIVRPCVPSGSTKFAVISYIPPAGVQLAAVSLYIQYPDGTVSLPGHANDQTVQDRVTVPFDAFSSVNDLDYALKLALVGNSDAIFPGIAVVVEFDTCTGAPDPTNDQFLCSVQSAADVAGNTVQGVTCSVTIF